MKLFISYPREDRRKVDELVEVLRRGGQTVWIDDQLKVALKWQQQLRDEIARCDAIVLALTPNWIESTYCQWEFITAVELGKTVIPVVLVMEGLNLPERIAEHQFVNFDGGFGDEAKVQKFLDDLAFIGTTLQPEPEDSQRKAAAAQSIEQSISAGNVTKSKVKLGQKNTAADRVESVRQSAQFGDISDSTIHIDQRNIIQQVLGNKWLLGLVALTVIVLVPLAIFISLPQKQQDELRMSVGMLQPTATPTLLPRFQEYDIGIAVAPFTSEDAEIDSQRIGNLVAQMEVKLVNELLGFCETSASSIIELSNVRSVPCPPIATASSIPPQVAILPAVYVEAFESTVMTVADEGDLSRPEARQRRAIRIAEELNADIVLYGTVTQDRRGRLELHPEFYVHPEYFADALEVTGAQRLGAEITVDSSEQDEAEATLTNRMKAVSDIFIGLIYYANQDYESALQMFELAAETPGWDETRGGEVLQVLMGNANLRIASNADMRGETAVGNEYLTTAIQFYENALGDNDRQRITYSRPYAGLASAEYLRWHLKFQGGEGSDLSILQSGAELAQLAIDNTTNTLDIGIQVRAIFAKLQIVFSMWLFHQGEMSADEVAALERDIDYLVGLIGEAYGNGTTSVEESYFEALALQALMAYALSGQDPALCEDEIDYLDEALEVIDNSSRNYLQREMFFLGWQGDCFLTLNDTDAAQDAYEEARDIAEDIGAEEDRCLYEIGLAQARGIEPPTDCQPEALEASAEQG